LLGSDLINGLGYQTQSFNNYLASCIQNNKYSVDKMRELKIETMQFDKNRQQSYKTYLHPDLVKVLDSV
jgi:hypothetical protein